MNLFRVIRLQYPGKVDIYKRGIVKLYEIDDKTAEQLWRNGCEYLEPTPEGMKKFFPDKKPIEVTRVNTTKKTSSKKGSATSE